MLKKLTIGLAGDVMLGRNVDMNISREGYAYPWGNLLPLLQNTDLNIVNFESALTSSKKKVSKVFNFKTAPENIEALTIANVSAVNLANNHVLDFSQEGLMETISALDKANIQHTGAGINAQDAERPAVITCKGLRVGVLGSTDNEPGWKADTGPGINYLDVSDGQDRLKILQSIEQMVKQTDLLIISIHWGPNMRETPEPAFISFAHNMIEAGADIIHGHSAHIFQGIEIYRNKPILYDTGDFVDDYMVDTFLRNDHSFFFLLEVSKKTVHCLQLVPVLISNCQVNRADKANADWSLWKMQQLSRPFGTVISDKGEVLLPTANAQL